MLVEITCDHDDAPTVLPLPGIVEHCSWRTASMSDGAPTELRELNPFRVEID